MTSSRLPCSWAQLVTGPTAMAQSALHYSRAQAIAGKKIFQDKRRTSTRSGAYTPLGSPLSIFCGARWSNMAGAPRRSEPAHPSTSLGHSNAPRCALRAFSGDPFHRQRVRQLRRGNGPGSEPGRSGPSEGRARFAAAANCSWVHSPRRLQGPVSRTMGGACRGPPRRWQQASQVRGLQCALRRAARLMRWACSAEGQVLSPLMGGMVARHRSTTLLPAGVSTVQRSRSGQSPRGCHRAT